jgi:hypothetical protein
MRRLEQCRKCLEARLDIGVVAGGGLAVRVLVDVRPFRQRHG